MPDLSLDYNGPANNVLMFITHAHHNLSAVCYKFPKLPTGMFMGM